jgi:RHS repeat-associated protein
VREYPTGLHYDAQGRMTGLVNWNVFPGGSTSNTTGWFYDQYRGWLNYKDYPNLTNYLTYGHTDAGRLNSRLWARGTNTSYGYNNAGDLASISYSDSTPGVSISYDRLGRKTSIVDGSVTTSRSYNNVGQLASESYSGGPLTGLMVSNTYDSLLRRAGAAVWNGSSRLTATTYGYDSASRLQSVSDGTNTASYTYLEYAPLISQIIFQHGGSTAMTTTKNYDNLFRLTSIASATSGSTVPIGFSYGYNAANQRVTQNVLDGPHWNYGYDSLGQVTNGTKYWGDNTLVPGEQFGYAYDAIGNRLGVYSGGTSNGAGLRTAGYSPNNLNQYTSRTVPNGLDILGVANPSAAVTVNGATQDYRRAQFYQKALTVTNSIGAVWLSVTSTSTFSGSSNSVIGSIFIPPATESFTYDVDGNLLSDGRFAYTWDAENRLITVSNIASIAANGKYLLNFVYDYAGRRIEKIVSTNTGSGWVAAYTNKFVYDGWNPIAVLDGGNNLLQSFTWGADLSGTVQSAGGVGGLTSMTIPSGLPNAGTYFPAYDGNGNVMTLVNATSGTIAAQYEYGPFGEVIRATGPMAFVNPFRFSTKYQDDETAMLYCGYRYYNPSIGRWLNRDPIGEAGGINLYGAMGNDLVNNVDPYGLWIWFGWFRSQPSQPAPYDPNSYKAMRDSMIGDPSDYDFNGKTAGQLTQDIGMAVPKGIAQAAMMIPFGAEEEAAAAAEEAAAAAKAARAAAKCEKAAQKLGNILGKNLKGGPKGDIAGAISDMVGNPIPKPGGGLWDHTQDLGNILRGLQNGVEQLQGATDPAQIAIRQQAEQAIQQIQQAIKGAGL